MGAPTRPSGSSRRWIAGAAALLLLSTLLLAGEACGRSGAVDEGTVEVRVPEGAGTLAIAERLEAAGLISHPRMFALYVGLRGDEGRLKAGLYRFASGAGWGEVVEAMRRGRVVSHPLTLPEGFTVREVAPRVARLSGVDPDSVRTLAADSSAARLLGVPGPTLEGYLFPDTYHFAEGVSPLQILRTMTERYRAYWTSERRERATELDLDERELVTLASIVEEEARLPGERPVIAGVYWNRLRRGMLLQADPTVQYALGEPKDRLLYRDIERVAEDPYNTYTHGGLPPGPIASPGAPSLDAVLWPADVPYLYFVARPDGSHVFSETLREHINAQNRIRSERRRGGESDRPGGGDGGNRGDG